MREGTRQTAEAGLSLLPGGGVLTSFARWLLPSIVLRRILLLEAVEFSYILIKLVSIIENPQVTDYVSKWLEGHFLLDAFERQVEARKA